MTETEGDLRWVAVLSADMVGFTAISHEIGAENAYQLIETVLALCTESIETAGGQVIDTAGDGLMAAFGAPVAMEAPSTAACLAASDFLLRLETATHDLEDRFGAKPAFRLGIAGGNCMVARAPDGQIRLIGDAVNAAARLQAMAQPGQAVLSDTIRAEASGAIETLDLGAIPIKGFADPVPLFALSTVHPETTRFEAAQDTSGPVAMVGRDGELSRALDAVHSGPVLITGPAGIGKSRLSHAVTQALDASKTALIGQCAQTGPATAFGPVLEMLRQASGLPWGTPVEDIIYALLDRAPELADRSAAEAFLAPVVEDRDQTTRALGARDFLTAMLAGLVGSTGVLLVLEDAHWVDSSTNAVFAGLVQRSIPFVATSRPGFRADWFQSDTILRLDLDPLGSAEIQALAAAQFGAPPDDTLAALITDKAEGVPLVAQEIARALQQSGRISTDEAGVHLTDATGPIFTGNLEHLILARIDALEPAEKAALQTASAIGRDFDAALLDAVLGRDSVLSTIAASPGLIDQTAAGQWRFSHALIRDAVYGSVLTSQKQAAHGAIAEALRQGIALQTGRDALVADHFLQSATPDRAVPYLVGAAKESLSVYAVYDVDQRCERAMQFLETDPSLVDEVTFCDLAVTWLRALDQIGDFHRVEQIGARVLPRLERGGYSLALSIVRTLTSIGMTHVRDYKGARALAERTRDEALAQGDEWGAAWAKVPLMRTFDETGWEDETVIEALAHEITPVADATGDRHLAMNALYLTSSGLRSAGYRIRALDVAQQIKGFSKTHNDRRSMGFALWAEALIHAIDNAPERVAEIVQEARTHAIPGSADERVTIGLELFAETFLSAPDTLRPRVQQLIDEAKRLGDFNISNSMEYTLILLELKAGNLALGWRMLSGLIDEAEWSGQVNFQRQGHITRSEILLAIAKLIDPAREAPPGRKSFPRKRPGLADLARFASLKFRATSLATDALKRVEALSPSKRGPFYSRSQTGLGLIAGSKGDRDTAIPLLEAGLKAAEEEDLHILAARAQRGLDQLGV